MASATPDVFLAEFRSQMRELKDSLEKFQSEVHKRFTASDTKITSLSTQIAAVQESVNIEVCGLKSDRAREHNSMLRELHDRLRPVPVLDPKVNNYEYNLDFPETVGDFISLRVRSEANERVLVSLAKFFDLHFQGWDTFAYAGDRGPSSPFEDTVQSPPSKLSPGPVEINVETDSENDSFGSNILVDEAQRDEELRKAIRRHWETAYTAVADSLGVDLTKVCEHALQLEKKPRAEILNIPFKRRAVEHLPNPPSKRVTLTDVRNDLLPNLPGPATPKPNKLTLADVTGMADVRFSPKSEHTFEELKWDDRPDPNSVPRRFPPPSSSGDGVRAKGSGSSIKSHNASRVLSEPAVPQVTRPIYPSATTVSPLSTPSLDTGFNPQPPLPKRFESSPADDSIPPPLSVGLGHPVDPRATTPRKFKRSSARGKSLSADGSPTQPFTNPPALAHKSISTSGSAERTSPWRPIGGRKQ